MVVKHLRLVCIWMMLKFPAFINKSILWPSLSLFQLRLSSVFNNKRTISVLIQLFSCGYRRWKNCWNHSQFKESGMVWNKWQHRVIMSGEQAECSAMIICSIAFVTYCLMLLWSNNHRSTYLDKKVLSFQMRHWF